MLSKLCPRIYIQISPQLLTLRNVKTKEEISEPPELAISHEGGTKIVAVGAQAKLAASSSSIEIINPFAHPRSLMSDFVLGEQVIRHQMKRLLSKSLLAVSPIVIVHPMGTPEGGYTQVEFRAFQEMAIGAGAQKVFIWTGKPLSDEEALSERQPLSGGTWVD
jgi:rod shape-determining protein MreB and related proteins